MAEAGGGIKLAPPSEKTTLKKPSLIRVTDSIYYQRLSAF